MRVAIKFRNKDCNSKAQLSHLVSLTEICHLCWLPSRGNGAVLQIMATHASFVYRQLMSVNKELETPTSVLSGLIPLPRFIYADLRSLSVSDCQRDCGWRRSGFGRVLVDSRLSRQPEVQRSVTGTCIKYTSRGAGLARNRNRLIKTAERRIT